MKSLSWDKEDDWEDPLLRQVGSSRLHFLTNDHRVVGLRNAVTTPWTSVQAWNNQAPAPAGITVYLSGPMSGHPDHNVPMFEQQAKKLRQLGFRVLSPPDLARQLGIKPEDPNANLRYEEMLINDLQAINTAQMLLLLGPAPWTSRGVRLELRQALLTNRIIMHTA